MPRKKKLSVYEELDKDMNDLIDEVEDIDELLVLWKEEDLASKLNIKRVERLKNKIKIFLKERQWDRYDDKNSKISVTLSTQKRESIDKEQLKLMLTESQIAQITRVKTFQTMRIITPEARKRLKNFIK